MKLGLVGIRALVFKICNREKTFIASYLVFMSFKGLTLIKTIKFQLKLY